MGLALLMASVHSCHQQYSGNNNYKQQQTSDSISLATLLNSYTDVSSLPLYQEGTCGQVSSYDTTGGNDDGFSGRFSYLRRNKDSTLVLLDVTGPGVINRIWTPTPSDDSLAFYIDDHSKASFTICYRDLFSGKVYPFVPPLCGKELGGNYCYLPILFREKCKIVFLGKKTQFHQIQYRLYPAGTRVKKFSLNLCEEEKKALQKIQTGWAQRSGFASGIYNLPEIQKIEKNIPIVPGKVIRVLGLNKGGRILGMEFSPASAFGGLKKNVDIRITWDGEKQPAVYCPLADFFGFAFGTPSMKSLLIGTDKQTLYCYFPMPFDNSAIIELISRDSAKEVSGQVILKCKIFYSPEKRDSAREGRFYSYSNRNNPAKINKPHVFLATNGKGHYVGTVLQAQGLKAGMTYFFEGDDSTAVDGRFRMHGTGSEDYFNGGWYALPDRWDAAMSLPLSGSLDYSLPFCRTGGYRLFLADKISFEKSFYHSIEHGPVSNAIAADYTSVCYYYCNARFNSTPPPSNISSEVFIPDTFMLYPQLMNLGIEGEISVKTEWLYPTGGETFVCTVENESALRISLREIPGGLYRLYMDFVKTPETCNYSLWQRQAPLTAWENGYHDSSKREESHYLADVHIDDRNNTITLRFEAPPGKNKFLLNRLILVKKKP